jgi:hypothetical protein
LSGRQRRAIELLIQGKTDHETATAVGVTRKTVNNWRNHNPDFQAALKQRRQEQWSLTTEHLRSLSGRAAEVLEKDLKDSDCRVRTAAAVHILRAVGLYGANLDPSQPTAAEVSRRESEHVALIKFLLLVIRDSDAGRRLLSEVRQSPQSALPQGPGRDGKDRKPAMGKRS